MRDIHSRVLDTPDTDPSQGAVHWFWVKSLWFSGMFIFGVIGGILYFSWGAFFAFILMSAIILCGGHSLGMHRKLIHDSFDCPKWLERLGAWLGTLVGLGGPFSMMHTHDMRDWAQRQPHCHPYFYHQTTLIKDFWWQIHCDLKLDSPPDFQFPEKLRHDPFMIMIQKTSMLQQLIPGICLYLIGGWGFVFWGICLRVAVSIMGHWFIGYWAHNHGPQDWIVKNAAAQGYNVPFCGWISFGECWHNNHHAFPESAKLGLYKNQSDPGWWVLVALAQIGWVSNLKTPADLPHRPELHHL